MQFFKMTVSTHTTRSVQFWFEEHEDALHHLPQSAQSPNLNIIEPLSSVVESMVRSRFPPPSSVMQPEDVHHEEWYNIPVAAIQNLHESIPKRIPAVLQQMVANSILIKKCLSITTVSIILSILSK
jgi:hypothetical protein